MKHFLSSWLIALALLVSGGEPLAFADGDFQDLHPNAKGGIIQPADPTAADQSDKAERPPPTLSYAVAVLSAIVVLCIVCVPSRKSESSTSR